MTYKFFARAGAKPYIFRNAQNAEQAMQMLRNRLAQQGHDPSLADRFTMVEGETPQERGQLEAKRMQENTAKAQKDVKAQESEEEGFFTRLAKGAVRTVIPNLAESYETTGAGGIMPATRDAVTLPLNVASMLNPTLKAPQLAGIAGVNLISDIGQQLDVNENIDPMRTGLGAVLGIAPATMSKVGEKMKDAGKATIQSVFLPRKVKAGAKAPDIEYGLESGLWRGLGKYSGLERVQERLKPFFDEMNRARNSGEKVDMQKAKEYALAIADEEIATSANRDAVKARLNAIFDAELADAESIVPAVTHKEAVPNPIFHASRDLAETAQETERRALKAKYTKEMKAWEKSVQNMRNSGMSDEQIAKVIGEAPIDPAVDVGLKTMPKPKMGEVTPLGEYGFNNADPWNVQTFVDVPEGLAYDIPISDALAKKSEFQRIAFEPDALLTRGDRYGNIIASEAMLDAVGDVNPEIRKAMQEASKDMGLMKMMQIRQAVGSSNSPLGLKDLIALSSGNPAMAMLSQYGLVSPAGGQLLYDVGKQSQKLGKSDIAKILAMRPNFLTSQVGNENE